MRAWSINHPPTDEWAAIDALLYSLDARSYRVLHNAQAQPAPAAELTQLRLATEKMRGITERARRDQEGSVNPPSMDLMRLAWWVNVTLAKSTPDASERSNCAAVAQDVATAMLRANPMDRRAVTAYVQTLLYNVTQAQKADRRAAASDARTALDLVQGSRRLETADPSLLFLEAQTEIALEPLLDGTERQNHLINAKETFKSAMGTRYIVTSGRQARELYEKIRDEDSRLDGHDVRFYQDIQRAAEIASKRNPNSRDFRSILEDASAKAKQLEAL
jgi:hypothetical protein